MSLPQDLYHWNNWSEDKKADIIKQVEDLIASNEELKVDIEQKEELIFAYEATRTPAVDRTIINLRAENDNLKQKLEGVKK